VRIRNFNTTVEAERETDGVFIFFGYTPNTEFLTGKVNMNEWGEIDTSEDLITSLSGVFAAGDCIHKKVRQVSNAVSDGIISALSAADYVHSKHMVVV
jgi:thioredoxin reductase (NADPH)